MNVKIIAVGPKHDRQLFTKLADYEKRLVTKLDWVLLPYSKFADDRARAAESRQILEKIRSRDFVVLLDETGSQLSSAGLAAKLEAWTSSGRQLVFVIGGAYGVGDELKSRADYILSLSQLTFPHQLIRLILVEQLYRAQCISGGHPYHHQ